MRERRDLFVFCSKGEQLGQTEATETFFAMTKLFQSKDVCIINYFERKNE